MVFEKNSNPLKTSLQDLLRQMLNVGASDLHLTVDVPPLFRIDGNLKAQAKRALNATDTLNLAYSIMSDDQRKRFEKHKEVDFAFTVKEVARFRANVFVQSGYTSCAFRLIPETLRSFEELGLPRSWESLSKNPTA